MHALYMNIKYCIAYLRTQLFHRLFLIVYFSTSILIIKPLSVNPIRVNVAQVPCVCCVRIIKPSLLVRFCEEAVFVYFDQQYFQLEFVNNNLHNDYKISTFRDSVIYFIILGMYHITYVLVVTRTPWRIF